MGRSAHLRGSHRGVPGPGAGGPVGAFARGPRGGRRGSAPGGLSRRRGTRRWGLANEHGRRRRMLVMSSDSSSEFLVFVTIPGTSERFSDRFERAALVGRSEDCDVRLPHALVSRRHAELSRVGAQVVIPDLGSRNGRIVEDSVLRGETVAVERACPTTHRGLSRRGRESPRPERLGDRTPARPGSARAGPRERGCGYL